MGYRIPFLSVPSSVLGTHPHGFVFLFFHQGESAGGGLSFVCREGRGRARPSSFSGLLQPYVRRLEDFRVVETSYRLLCPEPFRQQDTIQDGNHSVSSSFRASGRLDGLPRLEGSILAGSCPSGQPQVLEVRGPRQTLPVLGSLFRPLHDSPSITRVMALVLTFLHSLGIRVHRYLDDWLIQAHSREEVLRSLETVLSL